MYNKVDNRYELDQEWADKQYNIKTSVNGEYIEGIIVTALEGGIGYWACLNNTRPEWDNKPEDMPTAYYATRLILEGEWLCFNDAESGDEDKWGLNLERLLHGIGFMLHKEMCNGEFRFPIDCADMIFQYAIFWEIRYSQ